MWPVIINGFGMLHGKCLYVCDCVLSRYLFHKYRSCFSFLGYSIREIKIMNIGKNPNLHYPNGIQSKVFCLSEQIPRPISNSHCLHITMPLYEFSLSSHNNAFV